MFRFILAIMLLATLPALAEPMPRSLFFSGDELAQINAAVAEEPLAGGKDAALRLGAIMYLAPDRWTVWLQDRAFRPDTRDERISIVSVTPASVTLTVTSPLTGQRQTVTLHPNQSYNLLTGVSSF